ncbi:MAG TPA: hypothetical protein VHO67_00505 [Polyangia bacterium]|nr:hypothetical protein [Polyangia bacterium]
MALALSTRPLPTKGRARRDERKSRGTLPRKDVPVWTDLEEAFFAAAPPDEPEAASPPERFDDLDRVAAAADEPPLLLRISAALRRFVGAGS